MSKDTVSKGSVYIGAMNQKAITLNIWSEIQNPFLPKSLCINTDCQSNLYMSI